MILEQATSFSFNQYNVRSHINTLCAAFMNNDRIKSLITPKKRNRYSKLRNIVTFCYLKASKVRGVYATKDNSSILLYYRKSLDHFSISDVWRYVNLVFFTIGITRVKPIYDRETKVKMIRQSECNRRGDRDYYYAWMLAQRESKNEIASLLQIQRFLKAQALKANLPIYIETTLDRLVPLYERFGYHFYNSYFDLLSGTTIWFGRCDSRHK